VIVAQFFDPVAEKVVKRAPATADGIDALVDHLLSLSSERGHPALELVREDGSSASLGTDGVRAVVVWHNAISDSFHSVGTEKSRELRFDYMGSWSEVPGEWTVSLGSAADCLRNFIDLGSPDTEFVVFEPD